MSGQVLAQNNSKTLDDTGSLYQSKASQRSPFMAAASANASTSGNTSNLKGKLTSLEVSGRFKMTSMRAGHDPPTRGGT